MTMLVTGARGTVGRAVIADLVARGVPVRATSSDPDAAGAGLPDGVDVVRVDLGAPATLDDALEGVEGLFLYANAEGIDAVIERARAAGVGRVVLLSSAAAERGDDSPLTRRHTDVEDALAASDLAWTFLRPGQFAANARQWAPSIRAEGVVRAPFGQARTAPIHEADIAAVAVEALTGDGHAGRTYPMTGPELLTQARQAELIGEAIGRPVRFEEQTVEQARAAMSGRIPPFVVDSLLSMFASLVDHPADVHGDVVEGILGRPARSFATWATDHAADFT